MCNVFSLTSADTVDFIRKHVKCLSKTIKSNQSAMPVIFDEHYLHIAFVNSGNLDMA